MKKYAISIILLVYSFLSLATLFLWNAKGINTVTGDEPHYLVMSSGIVNHGSLEQTAPYKEEFKNRDIFKHGLAPKEAQPSPENTHAVLGPNGLFNVHNIGLPLLLGLPFMLGGVIGAKLSMVFFGALVVIAIWKFSFYFSENKTHRFWVVIASAISLPLIPASNQIYPDVLAGLIALIGLYWFLTAHEQRTGCFEVLLAVVIAFLPWLQIKFAATSVVLVLATSTKIYFDSKDIKRALRILIIAGASCVALALYNYYAFGKISGPYQSDALEISKTSLMVLLGLHFDQNQGFLVLNPINLIGVLAVGWIYRFNRTFTLIWGLVFLSLIVPNALHPNWYGGGSFSGRFGWAAAMVFLIPTVYGLLEIGKNREKIFRALIAGGVVLQLYFFYQYAIDSVNLYNKGAGTWLDAYSIFYYPIHLGMPMLYDSSWAYEYAPNYAWLVLVCVLLFMGFLNKEKLSSKTMVIASCFLSLVFLTAYLSDHHQSEEIVFKAIQLPSQAGRVENSNRIAEQNKDNLGFVNFGPYFPLRKGQYEVTFTYKSAGEISEPIGWIDVFNATSGVQVIQTPIYGTNNIIQKQKIKFETTQWRPNFFEFRTHWNGLSNIEMQNIVLKKHPPAE